MVKKGEKRRKKVFHLIRKSIAFLMALTLMLPQVNATKVSAADAATLTLNSIEKVDGTSYKINNITLEGLDEVTMVAVSVDKGSISITENSELYSINYDSMPSHRSALIRCKSKIQVDQIQSILDNIRYNVDIGGTQTVSIKISGNDTKNIPDNATITMKDSNGVTHYYIYVPEQSQISWIDAYNQAKTYYIDGLQGYLATITSEEEDKVLKKISADGAWSGGTRLLFNEDYDSGELTLKSTEGENFVWACGPEKGDIYHKGKKADEGENIYAVSGNGSSWGWDYTGAEHEPNNHGNETCMQVNYHNPATDKIGWNDLKYDSDTISGFFVEFSSYEGHAGNSSKTASATLTTTKASLMDKEKIGDIKFNYIDKTLNLTPYKYYVDGVLKFILGEGLDISDKLGQSITLIKPGNGFSTIDSDPVTVPIKAKRPASAVTYTVTQPTATTKTGTVSIPDTEEYSTDGGVTWLSPVGGKVEGLSEESSILVRLKATVDDPESHEVTVTINKAPTEDTPSTPGGEDTPSTPGGGDTPSTPGGGDTPSTPGGGDTPSTPSGDSKPSAPTENYTIPVKNENTVKVEAEIKEGKADVSEITTDTIDKVINNKDTESKVDTITIDLSGAKQEVTGVTLSKKSVETLAKATAEKDNGIETATIELSKATVVLDNKTLETLAEQAKGSQIELVVADTEQKKLNTAQQTTLNDYHVATTFEAYFTSDGERIHDFKGGKAVVSIDFKPETGKDTSYYHLVYVADDGKLTRYKTKYQGGKLMFTTTHFSDYAVIYDTSEKNETDTEEAPKEEDKKDDGTDAEEKVTLDTTYRKLRLRVPTATKTTNVLKWTKVSDADGYVIYGNKCNSNGETYKMVQQVVIKDNATTTWTDKNLASATYYKYYIKAYKLVDGKKVWIAKSKVVHSTTTGGNYGNAKSVKVNKTAVSLEVQKTFTIKAEQVVKDKPIANHQNIKFESSNSKIASVTGKGVIKAKKKGTCYIYVYAQNGVYQKIKVTVK